jgi:polyvinyl alcohol dehydrogenase (cytochrome)
MDWVKARALSAAALGGLFASALLACTGSGDDSVSSTTPPGPLDCSSTDAGDWPMYGQNVCNTRGASTTDPITAKTASKLTVKWKFTAAGDISTTPAVVGGQVYVPDWSGMLYRLDGATGQVVWMENVGQLVGLGDGGITIDAGGLNTGAARGYSVPLSRVTPVVSGNNVVFGLGSALSQALMAAVNKDTGALVWQTPLEGHPAALITSSPAIDGDTVYVGVSSGEELATGLVPGYPCCTFRGSVVALSASTGMIKWKTFMIEDSVYFQADGVTPSGYAGVAVWSGTPTVDRKRNSLYITTGNNYSVPTGATNPPPAGDHVESIVALDLTTGKIKWSQRMVGAKGDIWTLQNLNQPDYDFGCGANLFQVNAGGTTQDVVGAGQKSGVYWALNPDTGAVLWKTQVGLGGHLGGIHWGTAVDSNGIYVGVNDESGTPYTMGGKGPQAGMKTSVGSWAALDPTGGGSPSGKILWQIANPAMMAPLNGGSVNGPLAVSNGVLFAGSMDAMGMMYAIDVTSGAVLWSFASGASVYSGPAISNGVVYWGAGYPASRLGLGTSGPTQLYAFNIGP